MVLWVLILRNNKPIAAVPSRKGKTRSQIRKAMAGKLKKAFKFRIVTKAQLDKVLAKRGTSMMKKRTLRRKTRTTRRKRPAKRRRVKKKRRKKVARRRRKKK